MKAWFDTLQTYATIGLAVMLLAVAGYAVLQDRWLDDARRERDEAVQQRDAGMTAIEELERNSADRSSRETQVRTAREAIISAPEEDDAPISPVLLQGLRAADQIGGLE